MFTFKNSEVTWILVPSGAQVQPKIILDPDYLPGYLSVSYDYSLRQFVTTESSLNMMKGASYFMLKALFILKYLHSFLTILVMLGLISKFMTSQTGQQILTIHILPNITRCKSNQTMKFGQLIEHNMGNIFLQKSWRK